MRALALLILCTVLCTLAPATSAQWTDDPAANLVVTDADGAQVQPKVAPTPDGGVYVSWFSGAGFDVRIQKLDAGGHEVFAHDGLLVADRGFSSTVDYDLGLDAAGNALLTFRDDRGTGVQITAALVTAAGAQPWGPNGVVLTNTTGFVANPKITGTSDGGAVVAWADDGSVHLQKLDADGAPQWASDVVLTPSVGSYTAADLHAAGTDAILSLVHQTGIITAPKHLVAQKFDADGDALWGAEPVAVFDGGSLQIGNFPAFVPDGAGGGVFAWYSVAGGLQSYVQHILPDGSEAFAHDGVPVSTNAAQQRVAPDADYDPATGDIYVFWTELNGTQSMQGLYGQKVDASGNRLWTDNGFELIALGADAITNVRTVRGGPGAFVFWNDSPSFGQDQLFGATVSDGGAGAHAGGITVFAFDVSSTPSSKSRLEAARLAGSGDEVALAWQDDRAGNDDIYAQKVDPTGTIPVELTSFTATAGGSEVTLRWTTASETSNAGFEVQMQDGDAWEVLGFVEGHGTTTEAQTYSYTARDLGVGTHVFRLKQLDFDGRFELVGTVEATVGTPGTHVLSAVHPNPFNPQARFDLSVARTQHVSVALYNVLGRRVATLFDGALAADATRTFTLDGAALATGQYVVRVVGEHFAESRRVTLLK